MSVVASTVISMIIVFIIIIICVITIRETNTKLIWIHQKFRVGESLFSLY